MTDREEQADQEKPKDRASECQVEFIKQAVNLAVEIFDHDTLTPHQKKAGIKNLFRDVIFQVEEDCPEKRVPFDQLCLQCLVTYNVNMKNAKTLPQKQKCWNDYQACFLAHCAD